MFVKNSFENTITLKTTLKGEVKTFLVPAFESISLKLFSAGVLQLELDHHLTPLVLVGLTKEEIERTLEKIEKAQQEKTVAFKNFKIVLTEQNPYRRDCEAVIEGKVVFNTEETIFDLEEFIQYFYPY